VAIAIAPAANVLSLIALFRRATGGKARFDLVFANGVRARTQSIAGLSLQFDGAPEIESALKAHGKFEFDPSGTVTQIRSARNTFRSAVGAKANEALILLSDKDGVHVVAVIAPQSEIPALEPVLAGLLNALPSLPRDP